MEKFLPLKIIAWNENGVGMGGAEGQPVK